MTAQLATSKNVPRSNRREQPWRLYLATVTAAWLGVMGTGWAIVWVHETTPGESLPPLMHWPANSVMTLSANRPTLVVFAHPRCPCTRASLGELARIMAHCPNQADVRVLFFKPAGDTDWEKGDIWSSAEAIPGVTVISDDNGAETKKFNATTSGYALLYDTNGDLLFSGGITGSRGHSGDNIGRSAIEALLLNGLVDREIRRTFVFGCSLLGRFASPNVGGPR